MKAISLWQPWASLVAIGAKTLETRSWQTDYRGPLAIHATKAFPTEAKQAGRSKHFLPVLREADLISEYYNFRVPRGGIIAMCELTGCFRTASAESNWVEYPFANLRLPPPEPECFFGDYSPGRYAWRLENVRRIDPIVPCKGARGLWQVDIPLFDRLMAALEQTP